MSRQLTALEKRRVTGTSDVHVQLAAFGRLGIPAKPHNPTGRHVIECVAHTSQVRPHSTALQWTAIRDENIGTGLDNYRRLISERTGQHQENVHQHHTGSAQLLHAPDAAGEEADQRRNT